MRYGRQEFEYGKLSVLTSSCLNRDGVVVGHEHHASESFAGRGVH